MRPTARHSAARLVLAALFVVLVSCGTRPDTSPTIPRWSPGAVTTVPWIPTGTLKGVAWPRQSELVVAVGPATREESELIAVKPFDGTTQAVDLPSEVEGCRLIDYAPLVSSGSVGVLRGCITETGVPPETFAIVRDELSGEMTTVPISFGSTRPTLVTSAASAADDTLVGLGDQACGTVARLVDGAVQPLDLTPPGVTWSLADFLVNDGDDCTSVGVARAPTINGDALAFGVSDSAGITDPWERLSVPWSIVIRQGADAEPQVLVDDIFDLRALEFSPGGRLLALTGEVDGVPGVWVLELNGEISLAARGSFGDIAWAPTGDRIAALSDQPTSQISIVDVAPGEAVTKGD